MFQDLPLSNSICILSFAQHTFTIDSVSSLNSYGYSPHPLSTYLTWVRTLLTSPTLSGSPPTKPIIISITATTPTVLGEMLALIEETRQNLRTSYAAAYPGVIHSEEGWDPATLVAVELNTSCPNIRGAPPPAYSIPMLLPFLDILSDAYRADPSLAIGLKLPPYLYSTRFGEVVRYLATYTYESDRNGTERNPFAYIASTNTLGNSLLYADQVSNPSQAGDSSASGPPFALPTPLGGLAGAALHSLALGNVYSFSRTLANQSSPVVRAIKIVGIGGVTDRAAVERMKAAGASVVACATIFGREGVRAFEMLSQ